MTIDGALNDFIMDCRLKGLSDKTIDNYKCFVNAFISVSNIKYYCDINIDIVSRYIIGLYEKRLARATVSTYVRHLKVFLRWLESKGFINGIVENIKVPKTNKKVLRIYSDSEIRDIYSAINVRPDWLYYRNSAIISLMLDSGLRQGEVCMVGLDDIHMNDRILKVRGKGSKERYVPIGNVTNSFILSYMDSVPYEVNDSLFLTVKGYPLKVNTIKLLVSKMAKRLEFEFSSHKLRHNYATNYCIDHYNKYGQIDIYKLMVLLGHDEINTTRRYLHLANQIIASKEHLSHVDKVLT